MRALLLVLALIVAGCKPSHPDGGSGPIILSPSVAKHYVFDNEPVSITRKGG